MKFGTGFRLLCLVGVWGALVACSDLLIEHVSEPLAEPKAEPIAEPVVLQVSPDRLILYLAGDQGDEELFPSSSQVEARVLDGAGLSMSGAAGEVRWDASDAQVVKVDAMGRLTALSTGSAIIRATSIASPSLEATMSVSVKDAGRADVVVK